MKVRLTVTVEGLHKSTKPYRVATLACVELTRALRRDYAHVHDVSEIVVSVAAADVVPLAGLGRRETLKLGVSGA